MPDKLITGVSLEDFIDRNKRLLAYPHTSGLYMVVQLGAEEIRLTIEQFEQLSDLWGTFGSTFDYNAPAWWRETKEKREELNTRLEQRALAEAQGVIDAIAPAPPPRPRQPDAVTKIAARRDVSGVGSGTASDEAPAPAAAEVIDDSEEMEF